MNICGKGNFPECQFFTTGGCVSPSNCIYKIKQDFNTRATSNAMEISRNAEIARLTAEIARLTAEIAELRERLERSVELPARVMIERTIVNGKFKPTQKAQAFNGRIGVVYRDETKYKGLLVDICSEKVYDYEAAEARLAELKGEKK